MSDDLDTNINNYTYEELLEIAGFDNINQLSQDEITNRFNKIINKYKLEENQQYIKFFLKAKNKILNEFNEFNELEDIQTVLPLDKENKKINKEVITKYIIIDSKYRQHRTPYSCDPNSKTSSTNFLCTLTEKIKNTIKLKINSICIPKTWYTFDDFNGNTCFWVDISSSSNIISKIPIHITEGNYIPENLINEINRVINKQKIIYTDLSGLKVELIENISNPKIKFINLNNAFSNIYYTVYFYKKTDILSYETSCNTINNNVNVIHYDENLGYNLGFRIIDDNEDLMISLQPLGEKSAEVSLDVNGSQYFTLAIDDFNYNNVNNGGGITIENKQTKLELPSYYGKLLQDISYNNNLDTNIYLPTFPRKLTQAQIYSLNEIIAHRKESNNKLLSEKNLNNSNIIAVIHVPNINNETNISNNSNVIDLSIQLLNERNYLGPVCIEKLHIGLYDDKGKIVNLHGHDWSFTMIANELY